MEKTTVLIPSISCDQCVINIKKKLIELDGVSDVKGDPVSKIVTVVWQAPNTLDKINSKLNEIYYPAL